MDSRVLLSLVFVCFVATPLCAEPIVASKPESEPRSESEQRAIDVLREWSAENSNCTSVRGDFQRVWYDDVFQVQNHGEGQFGYLGPRHGFWRFGPPRQKPEGDFLKKTSQGKPYQYKEKEAEEWRLKKTRLLCINEEDKSYEEFILVDRLEKQNSWWFFNFNFNITADLPSPFLPGVPNQARVDDLIKNCYFKVLQETETHIYIAGKPIRAKDAANYREFKLFLRKKPWRLRATQYFHPGGNQNTVFRFSNIEMNPDEWDEPTLAGYLNQADHPVTAWRPEPVLQKNEEDEVTPGSGAVLLSMFLLCKLLF